MLCMTRRLLRLVARTVTAALVLAQLAVAAYACPAGAAAVPDAGASFSAAQATELSTAPAAIHAAPCASMSGGVDTAQPNLCAEHCKAGQQSERTPSIEMPTALLALRYLTPPAPPQAPRRCAAVAAPGDRAAVDPPHAILHCVRRT